MPTHSENRVMPYTPQQMFDLIADVAAYPKFLPWCSAARIKTRTQRHEGGEVMDADLVISFKVFRERFTSRVTLLPEEGRIDVEYLDGPFTYLINSWNFSPDDGGTRVQFHVDFEFKSKALQAIIGVVFYEAMRRIVGAFEKRAAALYASTPA
jgi:coenzyme Q-binding protein COQ10